MKKVNNSKTIIIFLALVYTLVFSGLTFAQNEKSTDSHIAKAFVKITMPNWLDISEEDLVQLFTNSDVAGKAANDLLGLSYEQSGVNISVPRLSSSKRSDGRRGKNTQLIHRITLTITIPDDKPPVAEQFLSTVIDNLKSSLNKIYNDEYRNKKNQVERAQENVRKAQYELMRLMDISSPADDIIADQLENNVDLSMLSPETEFSEALDILAETVEPPLKIFVNWSYLSNILDIDRTTPIEMKGYSSIKLKKALELILQSVSGDVDDLAYDIDEGVITIATTNYFDDRPKKTKQLSLTSLSIEILNKKKTSLASELERIERDKISLDAKQKATQQQIVRLSDAVDTKLSKDATLIQFNNTLEYLKNMFEYIKTEGKTVNTKKDDIFRFTEEINDLQLKILQHSDSIARKAGSEQIIELNKQLSQISIDLAGITAKELFFRKQLNQLEEEISIAVENQEKLPMIRAARQNVNLAENKLMYCQEEVSKMREPVVAATSLD